MPGQTNNTDILQALNQVIEAINDLETTVSTGQTVVNCSPDVTVNCGGSGINGGGNINGPSLGAPRPGTPVIDTDPSPDLPPTTDPPPAGFETWEEYDEYKCKAANALFDSCLGWFRFLGGLNAGAAGATAGAVFGTWLLAQISAALAAAAATTVAGGFAVTSALSAAFLVGFLASAPAWVIGAIVAAIAGITALVGVGFLIVFDSLADDFEAKREDVVCQLYDAQTVEEARGYLSTALNDSLNSFVIDPPYDTFEAIIRNVGSTVLGYMLPNSFVNQLFEPSSTVEAYTAAQIDCENCNECACVPELIWLPEAGAQGNGDLTVNGEIRTLNSELNANGNTYCQFDNLNDDPCCGFTLEIIEWTGSPLWHVSARCGSGTPVHALGTPVSVEAIDNFQEGGWFRFGNNPFTITIRMTCSQE